MIQRGRTSKREQTRTRALIFDEKREETDVHCSAQVQMDRRSSPTKKQSQLADTQRRRHRHREC